MLSKPLYCAYVVMYVRGIKSENSTRKTPMVVNRNGICRKMRKSGWAVAFLAGGRRDRTRVMPTRPHTRHIRARTRVAQPKPMRSNKAVSMRGKMMPPIPPAVDASPVAKPRLALNQWPTAAMHGVKVSDVPRPPRTPNDRMNWYNSGGQELAWVTHTHTQTIRISDGVYVRTG